MMKSGIKNQLYTNTKIQSLFQSMSWFSSMRSLWFFDSFLTFMVTLKTMLLLGTDFTVLAIAFIQASVFSPRAE